jgi:hypothetical protein
MPGGGFAIRLSGPVSAPAAPHTRRWESPERRGGGQLLNLLLNLPKSLVVEQARSE